MSERFTFSMFVSVRDRFVAELEATIVEGGESQIDVMREEVNGRELIANMYKLLRWQVVDPYPVASAKTRMIELVEEALDGFSDEVITRAKFFVYDTIEVCNLNT